VATHSDNMFFSKILKLFRKDDSEIPESKIEPITPVIIIKNEERRFCHFQCTFPSLNSLIGEGPSETPQVVTVACSIGSFGLYLEMVPNAGDNKTGVYLMLCDANNALDQIAGWVDYKLNTPESIDSAISFTTHTSNDKEESQTTVTLSRY